MTQYTDGTTTFELIDQSKLMWAECAALERVTGMTMAEITAKGQGCGCGHRIADHRQPGADAEDAPPELLTPKCRECGCDTPVENLPVEVSQALVWISMKRARPELTFKDVGGMSMLLEEVEGDEPDPTGADEAPSPSDA